MVAYNPRTNSEDATIVRTIKRENPFAQIDKGLINDARLTWKARGILIYLLSKPDDWRVMLGDIVNRGPDGLTAVISALNELREYGYARLERNRDEKGRITGSTWTVYEIPQADYAAPVGRKSTRKQGVDSDRVTGTKTECDIEAANLELMGASQEGKCPKTGFPFMGNHNAENRTLTNKGVLQDKEKDREGNKANALLGGGDAAHPETAKGFALIAGTSTTCKPSASEAWGQALRQIYGVLAEAFPAWKFRASPARNKAIKKFWTEHGRGEEGVQAVRELVAAVKASDYLMGRGKFAEIENRPRVDASWLFTPEKAEKALDGRYSNEAMAFLLESKDKPEAKKIQVRLAGENRSVWLTEAELSDAARYTRLKNQCPHTGLPQFIDKGPPKRA